MRLDNVELIHSGVFKKKSGAKIAQSCGDNIAESSSANLEVMDFINTEDIVEQEEGKVITLSSFLTISYPEGYYRHFVPVCWFSGNVFGVQHISRCSGQKVVSVLYLLYNDLD